MSYLNILHTFLVGRNIWKLQQSAKFVFSPSIWTIYNVFFSEYQQDSLMLTLYGIQFFYYFYILCSNFSKMILTTEVSQPFKSYLSNYKMILTTEKVITITWKVTSATTKVILAIEEEITTTLNVISAAIKVTLATEEHLPLQGWLFLRS